MIETTELARYLTSTVENFMFSKGFHRSKNWSREYIYHFEGGNYSFFMDNKFAMVGKQELVFELSMSLDYVIEIFREVMKYAKRNKFEVDLGLCYHNLRGDKSIRYVYVYSMEEARETIQSILQYLETDGFAFLRRFMDVHEIDTKENIEGNVMTEESIFGGNDLRKYIFALVIAKLCRPAYHLGELVAKYREALSALPNPWFYLEDYDPAVEHLLKTDIGTARDIEIPKLLS